MAGFKSCTWLVSFDVRTISRQKKLIKCNKFQLTVEWRILQNFGNVKICGIQHYSNLLRRVFFLFHMRTGVRPHIKKAKSPAQEVDNIELCTDTGQGQPYFGFKTKASQPKLYILSRQKSRGKIEKFVALSQIVKSQVGRQNSSLRKELSAVRYP